MDKGATLLNQKSTTMKTFPLGTLGGPLICKGHHDISPTKVIGFSPLGRPSTSGATGTSKSARKLLLGNIPGSLESSITTGVAPT